jgi:hypothetical protein
MGLLDIYYASQGQLTINDPDLVTQYPATVTGTPNSSQNPGGPPRNFDQPYTSNDTYLAVVAANLTRLQATLPITNLDVEDPGVQGGPIADTITQYPALATGTPTNTQNPGGPVKNFSQPWLPNITYLNTNPVAGATSGELRNTLPITNFDVENPGVQGGPNVDITTQYPANVTGTPNATQNPGAPPRNFSQFWLPNINYIVANPVAGATSGELRNTLSITNLDTTDPEVDGGLPYKTLKDPTIYPLTSNHTEEVRGYFAQPGSPPTKFFQSYDANSTYFDFIKAYI